MRNWKNLLLSLLYSKVLYCRQILKMRIRISFRIKTIGIENQYDSYWRTCADGSSILEVVYFTVLYTPVASIKSLIIVIIIAYVEEMIFLYGIYLIHSRISFCQTQNKEFILVHHISTWNCLKENVQNMYFRKIFQGNFAFKQQNKPKGKKQQWGVLWLV